MDIIESPELRSLVMDILTKAYNLLEPREGLHASDLIYCLTRSYWNKVDPLPSSETDVLRFSVGLGLERVIIQFGASRPVGSFEEDGIILTPDFILQGLHSELKTTRSAPGKWSDTWVRQIAAYCYATEQLAYNLIVLHIIQPQVKAYRLFFTQEELEEQWGDILSRKEVLTTALETQTPPQEFQWNEDWECAGCKYKLRCDLSASLRMVGPLPSNVVPITEWRGKSQVEVDPTRHIDFPIR